VVDHAPFFTVITCTWNSEAHLSDCLKSVEMQSDHDIEHLFVDGGSTDSTLAIIDAYAARVSYPVRVLARPPAGIADAMNFGMESARGRFIFITHSDDRFADATALAEVRRAIGDNDPAWVIANCRYIDGSGMPTAYFPMPMYSRRLLRTRNFVSHPSTAVNRTAVNRVGGFRPFKYAMDYDMWLRLADVEDPLVVSAVISEFRIHDAGLSSANPLETHRDDMRVRCDRERSVVERIRDRCRYMAIFVLIKSRS
jgi:glycosyltransferase involved in cell wall biosynthesis